MLLKKARERSREKGLPFDLTLEYIRSIWPEDNRCPALGCYFFEGTSISGGGPYSPSLDRITPRLGYVQGNVSVVSRRANQVMSDASPKEVMKVAEYFNYRSRV